MNQPPATSRNQPAVLFSQNKPAPAISHQPTEQADDMEYGGEPWWEGGSKGRRVKIDCGRAAGFGRSPVPSSRTGFFLSCVLLAHRAVFPLEWKEPFLSSKRESSFLSSGIITFKIHVSFLCSERSLNKAETPPHESISFKLQTAPIYQRYHTKTKLVKNDKKTPQLFQQPYFVVNKITNERRSKMKTLHTSTCA
jgi:hypothetical protein